MSVTEAIGGKVIVTTATKIKLLQRLGAFMSMKSILLQAKKNPALLSDPEFIRKAMEYFTKETNLTQQPFWQNLNDTLRIKATQYMVLQDLMETRQLRMVSTKDSAAVFVILSGTTEVKDGIHADDVLHGPGQVFGAMDLFHDATKDIDKFHNYAGDKLINNHVITAKLHKGSYLRISLYDMCKYVLAEDDDEDAKIDKKEFSRIAEISWEELTDDDKFYVKVYLRTRNLVDKNLFSFLDAYKFIPKNARTAAYRFYNECTHGRVITLDPKDPLSLYVIIEGGIKVEVEALRGQSHGNSLTCKRKGRRPMVVKTSTMPIMLFESGSLIFLREECFKVGHSQTIAEEEDHVFMTEAQPNMTSPQQSTTNAGNLMVRRDSDSSILSSALSISSAISAGSADPTARKKLLARSKKTVKEKPRDLYRINLVFDKFTTFLMIPFSHIQKILGNESLVMKSMAEGKERFLYNQVPLFNGILHKLYRN